MILEQLKDLADPRIKQVKKRKRRKPDGRAYANKRRAVFKIKGNR